MSVDVHLKDEGAFSFVVGETADGEDFVDSWVLGVLSVEDLGRVTVTSEVVDELAREAESQGLEVELG